MTMFHIKHHINMLLCHKRLHVAAQFTFSRVKYDGQSQLYIITIIFNQNFHFCGFEENLMDNVSY